jgi:hypothetical protein
MKSSEAVQLAGESGLIWLGGRATSGRKPKKVSRLVKVELLPRGAISWRDENGVLVDQTRTSSPVFVEKYEPEIPQSNTSVKEGN